MIPRPHIEQSGSVLIADDHAVFRFGLRHVIGALLAGSRVVEASTFDKALACLDDPDLKLALFDLGMPGLEGPRDLEKVRRRRPDIKVIVISGSEARDDVLDALRAGVHGYIVKSERTDTILRHIERVLEGEIYVPPLMAILPDAEEAQAAGVTSGPLPANLTYRQQAVLKLLAKGHPNKAIARELDISEGTVKMHVAAILRITGARNRAQAASLAAELFN